MGLFPSQREGLPQVILEEEEDNHQSGTKHVACGVLLV